MDERLFDVDEALAHRVDDVLAEIASSGETEDRLLDRLTVEQGSPGVYSVNLYETPHSVPVSFLISVRS